ncbi:MAG: Uma2 family endonuclease [Pirellulales bacterium]
MALVAPDYDPFVILYGVPWDMYVKIDEALGEHHTRHTYSEGTLEMRGLLYGVSWEEYKRFLDALGDFNLRHTYCEGTLEMMSPRKDHDWTKTMIGRMIEYMALSFDIPIQSVGSMTLTSDEVEKGLQPDEAYYVAHEWKVRGKDTYEPDVDPPPDLAIEVDVTNTCVPRLPTFARLHIPEIWRHDNDAVRFYRRVKSGRRRGKYQEIRKSVAFPFVEPADINEVLAKKGVLDENALVRAFLRRVRRRRNKN